MRSVRQIISERVSEALAIVLREDAAGADPLVRPSGDDKFGDYQSNCAMGLAKTLGKKPRELAQEIVEKLHIFDISETPEIAGPGFINFRLKPEFLALQLASIPSGQETGGREQEAGETSKSSELWKADGRKQAAGRRQQEPAECSEDDPLSPQPSASSAADRLGIAAVDQPAIVVIDMSSPNLAKEMHVGHLRPTIIGEAVARILEFQGHIVHRENHVGDWGTQFGMLVQFVRESHPDVLKDPEHLRLDDLEEFYVTAKNRFDSDAEFADKSRKAVVDLQSGDTATRTIWKAFCVESLRHCHAIYDLLDIQELEDRGESSYNDMLADVVAELEAKGVARKSEGAICVFPPGFTNKDGEPLPLIIQKSDGGYGYATTDLAALRQRIQETKATRIIYVVGNSQKQHFEMLFKTLELTGWADGRVQTVHLPTGMLLNAQGAPFKTREGGTIKLKDLLDEAIQRSREFLQANERDEDKKRGYSPQQIEDMSQVIGIAAVKYFELSHNLSTDYKFDWDQMLALEGNTAPYMLYAYARIQSIQRKADVDFTELPPGAPLEIKHPSEIGLAKQLVKLPEIIEQLGRELKPNLLTEYLYELSKAFSTFYDRKTGVRVIDAEPDDLKLSRLQLCKLTARTLKLGLDLLGIRTLERM